MNYKFAKSKKLIFILKNVILSPYRKGFIQDNIGDVRQSFLIAATLAGISTIVFIMTIDFLIENHNVYFGVLAMRLAFIAFCAGTVMVIAKQFSIIEKNPINSSLIFVVATLILFLFITILDPANHELYLHGATTMLVGFNIVLWIYPRATLLVNFFFLVIYGIFNYTISSNAGNSVEKIYHDIFLAFAYLSVGSTANILINYWRLMDYRATMKYKTALESLRSAYAEIRLISQIDDLTGLFNRRCLLMQFDLLRERAKRIGHSIGILILDIDHLKKINDKYGHRMGDLAIQAFSEIVKHRTRHSDICARIGGDEFCILASPIDKEGLITLTEDIKSKVSEAQLELPDQKGNFVPLSVSIGCTLYSAKNEKSFDELYKIIDEALYQSKDKGRNQITYANLDG